MMIIWVAFCLVLTNWLLGFGFTQHTTTRTIDDLRRCKLQLVVCAAIETFVSASYNAQQGKEQNDRSC